MANIKFLLNGCDICFYAEAPEDMTVKQLIEQASRIEPDYCACGVRQSDHEKSEIVFDYDDVHKTEDYVSCRIHKDGNWKEL